MNFMCPKHRAHLSKDPKEALIVWHRLINLARYQADHYHWQQSIMFYGNALEAAEIAFAKAPASLAVNRYMRTASELIYVMRLCDYGCSLELLVNTVKDKLEKNLYPANIQLLLRPLNDVAYSPLAEVHRWMSAMFEADRSQTKKQ